MIVNLLFPYLSIFPLGKTKAIMLNVQNCYIFPVNYSSDIMKSLSLIKVSLKVYC